MAHGQERLKKSKIIEEEEKLGNTQTFKCEPAEKGLKWAMPKYKPEFKELSLDYLAPKTYKGKRTV